MERIIVSSLIYTSAKTADNKHVVVSAPKQTALRIVKFGATLRRPEIIAYNTTT